MGNSMKTPGAVGCLQIGQTISVGTDEPDHPDEFYLEKVREACQRAGLGAVTRVRGKGVWPMAPYIGRENACALESLQGESNIFHCSDYMFPSSMSHSMCYAARLAKHIATTKGYYQEPRQPFCTRLCSLLHGMLEWSSFEASIARDRKCYALPLKDLDRTDEAKPTSSDYPSFLHVGS